MARRDMKARHRGRLWLAMAGLVALLMPFATRAQNPAQRKALAQFRSAQSFQIAGGVEASSVPLSKPGGLAFDSAGNLYVADTDDNVIREVNLSGIITTVAGTGDQGFAGDGGQATDALLDSPAGVAIDSNNNLYIADTHNNRIREVSNGFISTIAGTGTAGFSGDGGSALAAQLNLPTAVAIDPSNNVFFADTHNNRIRKIAGGNINTVAGNGDQTDSGDGGPATSAGLDSPGGVAVDASFNIYVGDTHNHVVRMVNASNGFITTIAGTGQKGFTGDGPATSAALSRPRGLAVSPSGSIYVADSDNNLIRVVSGGNITTVAGNGQQGFTGDTAASTSATLNTPRAVAVTASVQAFSDTGNNRVREIKNNYVNTIAGVGSSESIVIGGATSVVYGSGALTATFVNGGLTATGSVTFLDEGGPSPTAVGTSPLSSNAAVLDASHLSAGTHFLVASYAGDAKNPAVTSGVYVLVVNPVPLVAVANGVKLLYGQAIPALTGTLSGVLPQDNGNVTADFTTTATLTSATGTYPIGIILQGSAAPNYTASLGAASGSIVISQAPSTTALTLPTSNLVLGAPVTLTATVASTTSGTPTGTVNFFNGSVQLNATPVALSNGVASLTATSLPIGSVNLNAVYSGDTNFQASSSANQTGSVLSPDFTITSSPSTQSVLPLQSVNYILTINPTNPTFVYPVSLAVSGLPAGVSATLSPSSIASGAGASTITMTVSATSLAKISTDHDPWTRSGAMPALALLLFPLVFTRRLRRTSKMLMRSGRVLLALLALAALGAISGCGAGGFFSHGTGSHTVTITATSGPGTHATSVTLIVQ